MFFIFSTITFTENVALLSGHYHRTNQNHKAMLRCSSGCIQNKLSFLILGKKSIIITFVQKNLRNAARVASKYANSKNAKRKMHFYLLILSSCSRKTINATLEKRENYCVKPTRPH